MKNMTRKTKRVVNAIVIVLLIAYTAVWTSWIFACFNSASAECFIPERQDCFVWVNDIVVTANQDIYVRLEYLDRGSHGITNIKYDAADPDLNAQYHEELYENCGWTWIDWFIQEINGHPMQIHYCYDTAHGYHDYTFGYVN